MAEKQKQKRLQVRMTEEDFKLLEADAKASGLNVSEHARQKLLAHNGISSISDYMETRLALKEAELVEKYNSAMKEEAMKYFEYRMDNMSVLGFLGIQRDIRKRQKKAGYEFERIEKK